MTLTCIGLGAVCLAGLSGAGSGPVAGARAAHAAVAPAGARTADAGMPADSRSPKPERREKAPRGHRRSSTHRETASPRGETALAPANAPRAFRQRGQAAGRRARATCPPSSVICIENSLPGNPSTEWGVTGSGDSNIQGYATQMSVNHGATVQFKVNTAATSYRLDIYRIGYYGGMGARLIATVSPSATLPQTQPACITDGSVGLIDCGNWAVSASWAVPASAVSGVYIAKLVRTDGTTGASQIIFIVRDDDRQSDLLMKTSDTTWQAYNGYGGSSLYLRSGNPARAYKVSYNRPFTTNCCECCAGGNESWFFSMEYPMIRWLEANAYDVSYTSSIDVASTPQELLEHRILLSVGHDEYWSDSMRTNFQNARDSGVNLAFFSANEVFWKTRWENSIDGSGTPFRTLTCYKETHANAKIDPSPQWTGTWRDPRFSPPSNGGQPENALTGTLFRINGVVNDAMTVPAAYGPMRLWRNTSVATLPPGGVATFPAGTLGFEWDEEPDNGFAPAGIARMSSTTLSTTTKYLLDYGSTYGAGTATHSLTLYKAPSGALVFSAGTIQWSWGLDANHERPGTPTNISMQQATVNLFADMHAQPVTPQPGLVPATPSTDTTAPTTAITSPSNGATLSNTAPITVQGTAADAGGGVVAGVEVSFDGGTRWFQATGRESWQLTWTPGTSGPVTIQVRAVDDSGNLQANPDEVVVTVTASVFAASTTPANDSLNGGGSVELGVKFRTTTAGTITGVRFYKGPGNTGTHVGNLWNASGTRLATATFTNETASGWQEVTFATPVTVNPNTTYVASYFSPTGIFAGDTPFFVTEVVRGPLTALANGADGGNSVYAYGAASTFPTNTYQSINYYVDVVFSPTVQPEKNLWSATTVPAVQSHNDASSVVLGVKFQPSVTGVIKGIRFYKGPLNTGTHVGTLWTTGGTQLASATFTNETTTGWQQVNFATPVRVTAGTTYVASYLAPQGGFAYDLQYFGTDYRNSPLTAPASGSVGGNGVYAYSGTNTFPSNTYQSTNYWVDVVFAPSSTLWSTTAVPAVQSNPGSASVVLGVKFRSSTAGTIRGIRFYKGPFNTGTHVGTLWTTGGAQLASVTFTGESASGWQEALFASPVTISANTTYIASYLAPQGRFSYNVLYFTTPYINSPLTAVADGVQGGNGVYAYNGTNTFPTNTFQSANYWVDVLFDAA
ncbi:DUF4082 domain-containing protein [Nonomuraea sp. NPDC005501]|uniref:DUF4082 domain-containing protein n=1 Tax=Nonomuraea sp. NPDC005501 TaxID=3156884 RepID=UPI0033A53E3B